MKILAKLLLIGVIAATAHFFGQRNRYSTSQTAPAVKSVSPSASPAASISTDPSATVTLQKPSDPLAHTKASLRSKLHQWRESEANDPDNEEDRARLLQEMLAMLTDENVAEIIQSLSAEEMNTPFGTGALHHWMQLDSVMASNWLASRPDTTDEQTFAAANDWVGNRAGLQQYLDRLPDTAWKQGLLGAASSAMSIKDPLEAIRLAEEMNPGDAQTNLLRAVACSWVDTDPVAALDWVAGVKDPSLRERLIASANQSYALTDPFHAATWLISDVKSDGIVKEAALNILGTWVAKNPEQAAKWASQFPEGDTKAAAVKIVSQHWQQTDPAAATAWIRNLAKGLAASTH